MVSFYDVICGASIIDGKYLNDCIVVEMFPIVLFSSDNSSAFIPNFLLQAFQDKTSYFLNFKFLLEVFSSGLNHSNLIL